MKEKKEEKQEEKQEHVQFEETPQILPPEVPQVINETTTNKKNSLIVRIACDCRCCKWGTRGTNPITARCMGISRFKCKKGNKKTKQSFESRNNRIDFCIMRSFSGGVFNVKCFTLEIQYSVSLEYRMSSV